jgi:pimeloyl-ACP methyl ester carboxylesterase
MMAGWGLLFRCGYAFIFQGRHGFLPIMAGVAFLVLCGYSGNTAAADFRKAKCWFDIPRDREMTCGSLHVPENRGKNSGAEIALATVIFQPDRERYEPIVFLSGGPGQTAGISTRNDIDGWWQFISQQTWMIGRRVVVVDQRGVGKSKPALDCSRFFKADDWNRVLLSVDADTTGFDKLRKDKVVACRSALTSKGIDLSAYSTAENAADINDLRKELGIGRWLLYGVSYGTKVALEVMDTYPEGISAAILDSVLPLDVDYLKEDGPNLARSLKLLDRDCRLDRHCMRDLGKAVETVVRQLDRQPILLRSPTKPNAPERYRYVSGVDFLDILFDSFYDRDAVEMLPPLIQSTYKHDYGPLTQMIFDDEGTGTDISDGMDFSVTCSESAPSKSSGVRAEYWAGWAERVDYSWICPLWLPEVSARPKRQSHRSRIPTLLLSGEYDAATPSDWAYRTAKNLPLSQVVVFRGIGHDVVGSDPCGSEVVADFLANPGRKIATACLGHLEAPQFTNPDEQWVGVRTRRSAAGLPKGRPPSSRFNHRH